MSPAVPLIRRFARPAGLAFAAAALAALAAPAARGQVRESRPGGHNAMAPSDSRPTFLQGVGIDQKLNAQVPPDLTFRDEEGREVRLGDYFGRKPLVLALVYYECPGLCTVVLNEQGRMLKGLSLNVGESFDVLTVSFDPKDTPSLAAAKKQTYVKSYGRPGAEAGWHFLTGDPEPIRRLTDAVGFRYKWDEKNQQYVHSSGLMILTPEGRVSRYFFGVDYAPIDVKLALQEASGNKIGNPVERTVLYCFKFNPSTGKYGLVISRALQIGGVLTIVSIGLLMWFASRRGRAYAAAVAAETDAETDEEGRQEGHGRL